MNPNKTNNPTPSATPGNNSTPGITSSDAQTAREVLDKQNGGNLSRTKVEKKSGKTFFILMAIACLLLGFGLYYLVMVKPNNASQQVVSTQAITADNIQQAIEPSSQSQAGNQPAPAPLDTSVNFVIDENIVFLDSDTGQYMIRYREAVHPIESDLGKSAIQYYRTQGIDALSILARLQERESNRVNNNPFGTSDTADTNNTTQPESQLKVEYDHLKAENQDLKQLVEVQNQAINQLKSGLIQVANEIKANQQSKSSVSSASKPMSIPKGAKPKEAFSIVGDRAWLDLDGDMISVVVGDMLSDNKRVYAIDPSTNKVWIK